MAEVTGKLYAIHHGYYGAEITVSICHTDGGDLSVGLKINPGYLGTAELTPAGARLLADTIRDAAAVSQVTE